MIRRTPDCDLSTRNTFRMKVRCALLVEYDTIDDLQNLDFENLPQPVVSIGGGSNLLFTGNFPGTVLHGNINYIKYFDIGADSVPLAVGAGVVWDDLVAKTCADGLWGAENLSLIPGEVGAAAVQNIGAYGVEVKDIIAGVTCFDTQTRTKVAFKPHELHYGYRESLFKLPEVKGRYIITGVLFKLSRVYSPKMEYKGIRAAFPNGDPKTPQEVREAIIAIRNSKLPAVEQTGSAGSFFKNPVVSAAQFAQIAQGYDSVPHFILDGGFVKIPAAWLIDQCGFKGATHGGAAVYEKQPLVIVNATGTATPEDVTALENSIIQGVRARFGITLSPEVEHL